MAAPFNFSVADARILQFLAESGDTPQSPQLATLTSIALMQRAGFERDLENASFEPWVGRNLKLMAALELRVANAIRGTLPGADQTFVDRLLCKDIAIRTLLQICKFGHVPRFSHVTEVIRGQRRIMRWILSHHHPFPHAVRQRPNWIKVFEENWLCLLAIVPCFHNYPDELSSPKREEIRTLMCPRPDRITRIILADIHDLSEDGIAKLCKPTSCNTVPLYRR